ncbi:DUF397 domain-containing protein [Nocardia brevicatena]|uniref:DUF397 domain-containing protein n=1 Tax=Nocardia brevicatena TaxID=37327 RepID=UPI0005947363|nr:DUF397 domain-containing protein [Nocardia brevicatena]
MSVIVEGPSVKWFKSSHSGGGQDCVEIAFIGRDLIGVRDSKDPSGPALMFGSATWSAFTGWISGEQFGGV